MFRFFHSTNNCKHKFEQLYDAATSGLIEQFHHLCEQLQSSHHLTLEQIYLSKDSNGWITLQLAAIHGHTKIAEYIIQQCQRDQSVLNKVLEYEGTCGHTSLLLSLTNGFENFACLLLEAGASIDGITTRQRNVMYLIARSGFLSAANILLEKHGRDKLVQLAEALDSNGYTSLHAAALMGQSEFSSFLVNAPIQICLQTCSRDGTNALHLACRLSSHQSSSVKSGQTVVAILRSDQLSEVSTTLSELLHAADCFGSTPLHLACSSLNLEAIRALLTFVPNVQDLVAQDNDGYHPTHILCHEFCRCVTELNSLQKSNSNLKAKDIEDITLKLECCLECMTLFAGSNYPLLANDYCQVTIFHSLANCEPSIFLIRLLDILFEKISEPDSPSLETIFSLEDCSGWTSLHIAYHTDPARYQNFMKGDENENMVEIIDYFRYVASRLAVDFLHTLDFQRLRDTNSQKVARLRCGAHNRIPIEERRSILRDNYTLNGVIDYLHRISHDHTPRVVVLCGAGISTSAGIKDFRSQDGLYSQESTRQLFSVEFLMNQPHDFYNQVKEMFLPVVDGGIKPTPTHIFLRILEEKGWLTRIYTQNIDMLEYDVIQNPELIVECHGSFRRAYCFNPQCPSPLFIRTQHEMRHFFWDKIRENELPLCPHCQHFLRPDVTFFGEPLPSQFGQFSMTDLPSCDLLLVLGTSLVVYPVASLPSMVPPTAVRVLLNREPTGCFQFLRPGNIPSSNSSPSHESLAYHQVDTSSYRDVFYQGSCDDGSRLFIQELHEEQTTQHFNQLILEKCRDHV